MTVWVAAGVAAYLSCCAAAAWRLLFPGAGAPAAPPLDGMTSDVVEVDGIRVAISVRLPDAHGPVCVLQHGLGQSRGTWAEEVRLLAGLGFGVVLMDLPGHGESDRKATTFGPREARLLRGVIDGLGVSDRVTVLWGRSVGAAAVLEAAAGLPSVETVLLDCMFDSPLRSIARHAVGRVRFRWLLPLLPGVLAVLWCFLMARGALRFPIDRMADIAVPALLVTGTEDIGMPPSAQTRLAARARHPDSRTAFVDGARHYQSFARNPGLFDAWIRRHGRPPAAAAAGRSITPPGRRRQPA